MSGIDGLPERLLQVRQYQMKSQHAMDRLLQLGPNAWQRYETGSQVPGGRVLARIAALGINAHWLLTGDGVMRVPTAADSSSLDMRAALFARAIVSGESAEATHHHLVLEVLGLCGGMTPRQIRRVLADAESCIDFFCPLDSTSQRFLGAIAAASNDAARAREAQQA